VTGNYTQQVTHTVHFSYILICAFVWQFLNFAPYAMNNYFFVANTEEFFDLICTYECLYVLCGLVILTHRSLSEYIR
jgi:hypothetical protein